MAVQSFLFKWAAFEKFLGPLNGNDCGGVWHEAAGCSSLSAFQSHAEYLTNPAFWIAARSRFHSVFVWWIYGD
jgi:hypothetical protein